LLADGDYYHLVGSAYDNDGFFGDYNGVRHYVVTSVRMDTSPKSSRVTVPSGLTISRS
jgi:hypothetical protein